MARRTTERVDKGVSLARFPALVLGSLLLAFGLLAFLKNGDNPTGGFPDGTVEGTNFLGFEVNGWTAFFTSVAGGLLLFGAAQHLLAKTMSLLVGLALGACSVIALVDGDDVLGLAAANGWTKLGWGAAAAFLLINTLLPRKGGTKRDVVTRERDLDGPVPARRESVAAAPVATDRVRTERTEEPLATERARRTDEPLATERVDRTDEPLATERTGRTDESFATERTDRADEPLATERRDGSVSEDVVRDRTR